MQSKTATKFVIETKFDDEDPESPILRLTADSATNPGNIRVECVLLDGSIAWSVTSGTPAIGQPQSEAA